MADDGTSHQAQALAARIADREWYHKIDLGHGVSTPGRPYEAIWNNIREARAHVDYTGKSVLDIASWDGMWAFEAERLGAAKVVATEVFPHAIENFLLVREIIGSKVTPFYNASVYNLNETLAPILDMGLKEPALFDIVQNFGVLYHLRDPMFAISSTRSVVKTGGIAIFETAVILDDDASYAIINGYPDTSRIYDDATTWWAMTLPCLAEMLKSTLFRPLHWTTIWQDTREGRKIGRATVVAEAVSPADSGLPAILLNELQMTHRSPGIHLNHLRS